MEHERKGIRMGVWVIACAAVLRLLGGGLLQTVTAFLGEEETMSFLLYLQTGRVAQPESTQPTVTTSPVETVPEETAPPETTLPSFSAAEGELADMTYHCGYSPDLQALLERPLSLDLTGEEPRVLILHSHATESYTRSPGEDYTESSDYRTLDTDYNLVSIGAYLTSLLESRGIRVIHDQTLHDSPSYNAAYSNARSAIRSYLEAYPTIELVLDLHRDASSSENGTQLSTHATVSGEPSAQLMLVVGTDGGGLYHPNWQENLSLGLKLHAALEYVSPGICRPISFRSERFNQDLSGGALLVEVGAAGDSHSEALTACKALAEAIVLLSASSR